MQYKINEKVIYPAHGVALIKDIVEKSVSGNTLKFYRLSFLYKDMTILIPVNNCDQTGVRRLEPATSLDAMVKEYADRVTGKRFNEIDVSPSGWNKRYKDYQLRVQGGDFKGVLAIYQELMYIAQGKDLSFGEKGLLHSTEELLTQELMVSKDIDRSSALETLRSPFKQFIVSYAPQHRTTTL